MVEAAARGFTHLDGMNHLTLTRAMVLPDWRNPEKRIWPPYDGAPDPDEAASRPRGLARGRASRRAGKVPRRSDRRSDDGLSRSRSERIDWDGLMFVRNEIERLQRTEEAIVVATGAPRPRDGRTRTRFAPFGIRLCGVRFRRQRTCRHIHLWQLCAKDRDRGEPRGPSPPTPPCVRVRTRRFEKLR